MCTSGGSPTVLSPEDNSVTHGNLANDYLRNEYITLDGSSGAEWIQVSNIIIAEHYCYTNLDFHLLLTGRR